jgi:hypothetical protein
MLVEDIEHVILLHRVLFLFLVPNDADVHTNTGRPFQEAVLCIDGFNQLFITLYDAHKRLR